MSDKLTIAIAATYEETENLVSQELAKLGEDDPAFEIWLGARKFSPTEMLAEIKGKTETGQKYVNGYIEGCKFLNS